MAKAKRKQKSNVVSLDKARKKKVSDKKKKFFKLGFEIIGHKFLYYEGANHGLSGKVIADSKYDALEDEYKKLADELDLPTTASDMVGFDSSRPSCKMVMQHLIATKGKFPGTVAGVQKEMKKVRVKLTAYHDALAEVLDEVNLTEAKAKKIRIKMKKRMKP